MATATTNKTRQDAVRQGKRLEYFTIAYNSAEGLVSIVAGLFAGSVSLIKFGLDSLIKAASGAALLWRLHHDLNPSRREQVERTTLRIIGASFRCPGPVHPGRVRFDADLPPIVGTKRCRYHRRRRFRRRDAVACECETPGRCWNRKWGDES